MTTPTPPPSSDLDRLESLARGATPGPWMLLGCGEKHDHQSFGCITTRTADRWKCDTKADMEWKAAANPSAILALIARLRAAEAVVDTARKYVGTRGVYHADALDEAVAAHDARCTAANPSAILALVRELRAARDFIDAMCCDERLGETACALRTIMSAKESDRG